MPYSPIGKTILILLGLGLLAVAARFIRPARRSGAQVRDGESATAQLLDWFLAHHDAETIDYQLIQEGGFEELTPEEQSLKRLELIQDIFLIIHDLSDQEYVDTLAEEIYGRLYD